MKTTLNREETPAGSNIYRNVEKTNPRLQRSRTIATPNLKRNMANTYSQLYIHFVFALQKCQASIRLFCKERLDQFRKHSNPRAVRNHTRNSFLAYIFLVAILLASFASLATAQSLTIQTCCHTPPNPNTNIAWAFDTCAHRALHYNGKYWREFFIDRVDSMWLCGEFVIMWAHHAMYNQGNGHHLIAHFCNPNDLAERVNHIFYGSKIVAFQTFREYRHPVMYEAWTEVRWNDLSPEDPKSFFAMPFSPACGDFKIDTLLGTPVLCAPGYFPFRAMYARGSCYSFNTWGMLDGDGSWRISPQYEKPFHFKNGIAEVEYYGQKRRINEQGEFID